MSDEFVNVFVPAVAGVPVLWLGDPGIGKSQIIESAMKAAELFCHTEVLSISDPCDIGGLIVRNGETAGRLLPDWFVKLKNLGRGCLFLDELTTCPPMNQASALRLVRDRAINGASLSKEVWVMAAANPPETAANGCDLAPAMANRFCHLTWKPSHVEWAEGLIGGFQPMPLPVPSSNWETEQLSLAQGSVAGFIHARSELLHGLPDASVGRSGPWPSPRTWEYSTRVLALCRDLRIEPDPYLAGLVGPGAALEFTEWLKHANLPHPETVLASSSTFPVQVRSELVYAVCSAVVGAVLVTPSKERWLACWEYLERNHDAGHGDVVIEKMRQIIKRAPKGSLPKFPRLGRLADLMQQAGIVG